MNELTHELLQELVEKDFDRMDFADKPMTEYCGYHRTKHIQMATQMTIQYIQAKRESAISYSEIKDFIHGLNHIFFNGAAAGQFFTWQKGGKDEG